MDLSFTRFRVGAEPTAMPHDLAVLMVGVAARQAASPTAAAQAGCALEAPDPRLFEPVDGAFNGATAHAIAEWRDGEDPGGENDDTPVDEARIYPPVSADGEGAGTTNGNDTNEDGAAAPREV